MKASELILGVVADARELDKDTYSPNAATWHRPWRCTSFAGREIEAKCLICFGGAYLTRGFRPDQRVTLEDLNHETASTCVFLDRIRERHFDGIRNFAEGAKLDQPELLENDLKWLHHVHPEFTTPQMTGFNDWPSFEQFLEQMELLGNELARRDL